MYHPPNRNDNETMRLLKCTPHRTCGVRFCPSCRTRKLERERQYHHELITDAGCGFVTLHIVSTNITHEQLETAFTNRTNAINRLHRRRGVKPIVRGYIVRHTVRYDDTNDTFILDTRLAISVQKSYRCSPAYIKRDEWIALYDAGEPNTEVHCLQYSASARSYERVSMWLHVHLIDPSVFKHSKMVSQTAYDVCKKRPSVIYGGNLKRKGVTS